MLVVINTQKGLLQYTRLPFGVSAAPAIFQRTIPPYLCVYLDDIFVTGKTEEENLNAFLSRLEETGLWV